MANKSIVWNDFNSSIATSAQESPCSSCQQSFFVEDSPLSTFVPNSPIHQSTPIGSHLGKRSEISDSSLLFNDVELDASYTPTSPGNFIQTSSTSQLSSVLSVTCCENRCLASFSLLELESSQKSFLSWKKVDQQQFLLDAVIATFHWQTQHFACYQLLGRRFAKWHLATYLACQQNEWEG